MGHMCEGQGRIGYEIRTHTLTLIGINDKKNRTRKWTNLYRFHTSNMLTQGLQHLLPKKLRFQPVGVHVVLGN